MAQLLLVHLHSAPNQTPVHPVETPPPHTYIREDNSIHKGVERLKKVRVCVRIAHSEWSLPVSPLSHRTENLEVFQKEFTKSIQ